MCCITCKLPAGKKPAAVSLHESQNITNEIDSTPKAGDADDAERMPSALDFLNAQQAAPMEVLPSLADCLAANAAAQVQAAQPVQAAHASPTGHASVAAAVAGGAGPAAGVAQVLLQYHGSLEPEQQRELEQRVVSHSHSLSRTISDRGHASLVRQASDFCRQLVDSTPGHMTVAPPIDFFAAAGAAACCTSAPCMCSSAAAKRHDGQLLL